MKANNRMNSLARFQINLHGMLFASLFLLIITFGQASATDWPSMTLSKDGTPISYEVYGEGEPTLVFVHGWSCDARYWRAQIPEFSKKHKVIALDLAGHGNSGMSRTKYSMAAFGEDVRAVVEATGSDKVVLIGHSMGGLVIAEAARLMPNRVIGLLGIDTLTNIEYPLTSEELAQMTAPMKKDFTSGSRQFVESMLLPDTDPELREWILADMSTAPPHIALSAMDELLNQYITGDIAKLFAEVRIPVATVNADMWPINYEANRRHMLSFEAIVLKGTDHFLMMNSSEEFTSALVKAINKVLEK